MRLPTACEAEVWQERTALPSICTVQAPHRPEPQPYLVPVSLTCSRMTQSSGVWGSASALAGLPLIVKAIVISFSSKVFPGCGVWPDCFFGTADPKVRRAERLNGDAEEFSDAEF